MALIGQRKKEKMKGGKRKGQERESTFPALGASRPARGAGSCPGREKRASESDEG